MVKVIPNDDKTIRKDNYGKKLMFIFIYFKVLGHKIKFLHNLESLCMKIVNLGRTLYCGFV